MTFDVRLYGNSESFEIWNQNKPRFTISVQLNLSRFTMAKKIVCYLIFYFIFFLILSPRVHILVHMKRFWNRENEENEEKKKNMKLCCGEHYMYVCIQLLAVCFGYCYFIHCFEWQNKTKTKIKEKKRKETTTKIEKAYEFRCAKRLWYAGTTYIHAIAHHHRNTVNFCFWIISNKYERE